MNRLFKFLPAIAALFLAGMLYLTSASGDNPQGYGGNSNLSVGTSPVVVVNQGGKVSYVAHNRAASLPVICWPISTNSAPAASPTPGAGVPMIEVPASGNLTDAVAPEQSRDPLLQGWACSMPVATSTAVMDSVWR